MNELSADLAALTMDDVVRFYDELKPIASSLLRGERRDHTLQTTALVNEALVRIAGPDWELRAWRTPGHFFEAITRNMRWVLIDHAKRRSAARRGAKSKKIPLDDVLLMCDEQPEQLVEMNELLEQILRADDLAEPERKYRVAKLRTFGGRTEEETAQLLAVSRATVRRDWKVVRAWLAARMGLEGVEDV